MATVTQTYDAATGFFEGGGTHFFIENSTTDDMYAVIVTDSLVGSVETITFSQGNGSNRDIDEVVEISTQLISLGSGVTEEIITTFRGDYGAISITTAATTGTIKIIVNNGN